MAKITRVQSLGHGRTRIGAVGHGFMDVSATYADNPQGWTVSIEQTNITDPRVREEILSEFRVMEGLETPRPGKRNRIQIINWREHGDYESYCHSGVFAADDDSDVLDETLRLHNVAERGEGDTYETYYVNDDIEFYDGQILEHNGRKFRLSITEVK
jgi:hypothetical protein